MEEIKAYIDNYGRLITFPRSQDLYHHGVMGQKWGVIRYQPYPANYHGEGGFTKAHYTR